MRTPNMKHGGGALLVVVLLLAMCWPAAASEPAEEAPGRAMAHQVVKNQALWNTTDHSQHAGLKKQFKNGKEITDACLSCHNQAADQFKQTVHWTWVADDEHGKANYSLNNFCISTNRTADKGCMSCHPGWGMKTESINCLACHGRKKINWGEAFEDYNAFAGSDDAEEQEIAEEIQADIQAAAQAVGLPGRSNCGACHFEGGGGDGVKHGDLDSSLTNPDKPLDVHMGLDGQDFNCTRCHTTVNHNIAGRLYTAPAASHRKSLVEDDLTTKIMCESCHTDKPHKTSGKANDHTDKVACQTCHIPEFARVNPTKMSWDWSKAGKRKDGKPFKTKDAFGQFDYLSMKGQMKWEKNVRPEYAWYNGSIESISMKDRINPGDTVAVSRPVGSREDENSRISPFKVHRGRQPYDKVHKTLVAPILSGPKGFFKTMDWDTTVPMGQKALGLPYSGEMGFVDTTYVFPTTHMVAPKDQVVACGECHTRNGSRLENLKGFYMPGRDRNKWINTLGWIVVLGSLVGVTFHGLGRIFSGTRNGRKEA